MKTILKTLVFLFLIVIVIVSVLSLQKYQSSDLTKRIIISNLKQIESENIFDFSSTEYFNKSLNNFKGCKCGNNFFMQPDFVLKSAKEIVNDRETKVSCCGWDFFWLQGNVHPRIEILDNTANFYFSIDLNSEGMQYSYSAISTMKIVNNRIVPNMALKVFVDEILNSQEFVILEKDNEDGKDDYLVKDLGDKFLIYQIFNGSENPYSINFQLYSKRKFFTSLF